MPEIYDVAVIGGGPAGYVAAVRAAQLGANVVLFERSELGGTCLNRGCVPTKTFVRTGGCLRSFETAPARGIVFSAPVSASVDIKKVVGYKNRVVKKLTGGVSGLLRSNKVAVVRGDARLTEDRRVLCGDRLYEAKNIILCGGSKVARIHIPGIDSPNVVSSDELLDADHLPEKLFIIGAGIIGCEFAFPFAHFGSRVSIVDAADRICPMLDRDLSAGVEKSLRALGVGVITGKRVEKIEDRGGKSYVHVGGVEHEADTVLLCVGRSPVLDCLGDMADRFEMKDGHVAVDLNCRTNVPGVYACGDITDRANLANAAIKMGEAAAENCMGCEKSVDLTKVPRCIHSEPEAASLGLTEDEAKTLYGDKLLVGRFPFAANGMALADGETEGFVKVLAEKEYGEIVGVHVLGGYASEMISEAIDLMTCEISVFEAADMIHPHPALSEALIEACNDALGRSIHLPRRG